MEQTEQEPGELSAAVLSSLAERSNPAALDRGAARLAQQYALLMDNAAPSRSYATSLRVLGNFLDGALSSIAEGTPLHREVSGAWDKVSSALAEHSVASDLGPKLLAALQQLGLTPAARSKVAGAALEQPSPEQERRATVLHLLQNEASERNTNAS